MEIRTGVHALELWIAAAIGVALASCGPLTPSVERVGERVDSSPSSQEVRETIKLAHAESSQRLNVETVIVLPKDEDARELKSEHSFELSRSEIRELISVEGSVEIEIPSEFDLTSARIQLVTMYLHAPREKPRFEAELRSERKLEIRKLDKSEVQLRGLRGITLNLIDEDEGFTLGL